MKTVTLLIALLACLGLTACALFDDQGLAERAGVLEIETVEKPLLDAKGDPVLDEQGNEIIEVITTRNPGQTLRRGVEYLGDGVWGQVGTAALALLTLVGGIWGTTRERKKRKATEAATIELIRAGKRAEVSDALKKELGARNYSDPIRAKVRELAMKT